MEEFTNNLPAGYVLDQYSISAVLGTGSFGITYKAYDNQLHQEVAIKEYLPSDMAKRASDSASVQPRQDSSGQFRYGLDKFLEEARVLARFRHPNIVRVSRFLEANGTAYLVMDYVEGESLLDYLKRTGKPVSEAQLKAWFIPILQGLVTVHAAGFLHRDIKPGNIYLRDNGEPLLIDFGAARQAIGEHSKSVTGIFTAGYAPTEQYGTDAKKQGPWTDLYSIGATMYRCIVGQTPIDAPTRQSALVEGDADPLIPASVKGSGQYSPAFLQLIDELLVLPIKDRPQTTAPVLAALAAGRSVSGNEPYAVDTVVTEKSGSAEAETVVASDRQQAPASKKPVPPKSTPEDVLVDQPKARKPVSQNRKFIGALVLGLLVASLVWIFGDSSEQEQAQKRMDAEQQRRLAKEPKDEPGTVPGTKQTASTSDSPASDMGHLTLELDPPSAKVVLPDIKPRYTPGMSLAVGKYNLIIKAPGYVTWEGTFDMGPDGCCPGTIKLERDLEAEAQKRAQAEAKAAVETKPYILVDAGGGVLRQPATGLEWTQADNGYVIDWGDAGTYCAGEGSGWRLPSTAELQSLYNASGKRNSCGSYPCKVSPLFRLTGPWGWSNEANSSSEAWYTNLLDGSRSSGSVSNRNLLRALCVRRS